MHSQLPIVSLVSCFLKYGPVRDMFDKAVGGVLSNGPLTPKGIYEALVETVRSCHMLKLPPAWVAASLGTQHHSGLAPWMLKLKVIQKAAAATAGAATAAAGAAASTTVVALGEQEQLYEILPWNASRMTALWGINAELMQFQSRPCKPRTLSQFRSLPSCARRRWSCQESAGTRCVGK